MTSELLAAALDFAGSGWHVLPLRPGSKLPATKHGLHDATVDAAVIGGLWQRWPRANVGIRTGACSGLFVLDIDAHHGGYASLAALEAEHAQLPATLTVATPSGGEHRYFAWPGGDIRNSAGLLGPGLDIRGDGGYVVAPPSALTGGGSYRPRHPLDVADAPAWLLALVAKPKPVPRPVVIVSTSSAGRSRYGAAALARAAQEVANAPAGQGNSALNGSAYSLGRLVGADLLDRRDVEEALLDAAVARGGETEARARAIIAYGIDAGAALPRRVATFEAVSR